ncbi:MAG: hypothetical protein FWD69_16640 [Polyangiaceae bacterium]|nr:hypothetical protein [Polyangiaceae bacterium]
MGVEQFFDGMAEAEMVGSGVHFAIGQYLVKTQSMKAIEGFKGPCFIAEFEILESSAEEDPVGARARGS